MFLLHVSAATISHATEQIYFDFNQGNYKVQGKCIKTRV